MEINTYTFTLENMTEESNISIDLFMTHLVNENIISMEQRDKAMQYRIIHRKANLFGHIWNRFFGEESDKPKRVVVKVIS